MEEGYDRPAMRATGPCSITFEITVYVPFRGEDRRAGLKPTPTGPVQGVWEAARRHCGFGRSMRAWRRTLVRVVRLQNSSGAARGSTEHKGGTELPKSSGHRRLGRAEEASGESEHNAISRTNAGL
jgi:hypothetical protein